MDVMPFTCDQCKAPMGIMIFPDGVSGQTIKMIFNALDLVVQCPECDFVAKKIRRDREAAQKEAESQKRKGLNASDVEEKKPRKKKPT